MNKSGKEYECSACKTIVYIPKWRKRKNNFCCKKCADDFRRGVLKVGKIDKCSICGNDIIVTPFMESHGKGKSCSKECAKISIANTLTGRKQSQYTKLKRSKSLKGFVYKDKNRKYESRVKENHWNWQNGKTKESRLFRGSIEYRLWRLNVLERDKFKCMDCGVSGVDLEGHHIKPIKTFPDLALDVDNGITLCHDCHNKTKWKEDKFENRYLNILRNI